MGVCLGVMFEPAVPEGEELYDSEGKCLAQELSALDLICESRGVRRISEFVDASAYDLSEEELEDIPPEYREEFSSEPGSEAEYRDCSELLETIAAIKMHLQTQDNQTQLSEDVVKAVIEDLTLLERSLQVAFQAGAKCMLLLW